MNKDQVELQQNEAEQTEERCAVQWQIEITVNLIE